MESLIIMHEFDVFYAMSERGEPKKNTSGRCFAVPNLPKSYLFVGGWLQPLRKETPQKKKSAWMSLFRFDAGYLACGPRLSTQVVNIPQPTTAWQFVVTCCGWLSGPLKGCW